MDKYKMIKEIGDGAFGSVWRAINKRTGEVVAIKKMKKKYYSWEECVNLREVKYLRRLNHNNIVKLKEVLRENDICFFVFEHMELNLYQVMKDRPKAFSESEIRNWSFQIFQALSYMHQRGYFHRDLKPENLLVSKDIIKVADFGLAREISSQAPYTEYVSTRWYRAPEVLLQSTSYDPSVDMWAMGAIMAELFTLDPLFPGSSEPDEIYKICSILGTPDRNSWADGLKLAEAMKFKFPEFRSCHLSELIPSASDDAIDLITSLCCWDPCKRPKASEVLQHPFFQPCFAAQPTLRPRVAGIPTTPPAALDQKRTRRYSTSVLYATKSATNASSVKPNASSRMDIQKKPEAASEDQVKNVRTIKKNLKSTQPRPPSRKAPGLLGRSSSNKVANLSKRLEQTELTSSKVDTANKVSRPPISSSMRQTEKPLPTSIKAGGWHGRTNYLNRSCDSSPDRTKKVAGGASSDKCTPSLVSLC